MNDAYSNMSNDDKADLHDLWVQNEIDKRIKELMNMKARLLDEYGIFGGGISVNEQHEKINKELESYGVQP